ncbi:MAG: hypothetical protein LBH48_07070, partial [Bifidobacteriaceae bacterium]|nr:hypothetical protein [Bifidobacteriaceae bacterium]
MRAGIVLGMVLTLTAGATLVACSPQDQGDQANGQNAPAEESGAPQQSDLATATAEVSDLVSSVTASCPVGYGETASLVASGSGVVTELPDVEDVISAGETLYRLDDKPVILLPGRLPAWRDMTPGMDDGRDITQLKRALAKLGFADSDELGTSREWTWSLSRAVSELRDAAGYDKGYSLPRSWFQFGPSRLRVDALLATKGQQVEPGAELLSTTGTTPQVTCQIATSQRAYATEGGAADLTFSDGTEASGAIVEVSAKSASGPEESDYLAVIIEVTGDALTHQQTGTEARVQLTDTVALGVLAVPVTALVALTDGGYGVMKAGDSPTYTRVQTGRFSG